jgi:branched-chain amino acid transport system substrate-binding protein
MRLIKTAGILVLALAALICFAPLTQAAEPIKIAQVVGLTGPLEAYAKQSVTGFNMGLEYATDGSMELLGRPIEIIVKDTQLKPQKGKQLLTEAYKDDKVDLAVGPISSGVAVAMLPVAAEFKKILLVEPAVADTITGSAWNRYIFRTGRNSSQDAIANAVAMAKPGAVFATIAQDYSFGRDGIKAYKEAAEAQGTKVIHSEFVPATTADFTAPAQRIIQAMKDVKGEKFIFVYWAGKNNPMKKLHAMKLDKKYGIKITAGGNILDALKAYKPLKGLQGATYYYYTNPDNKINDWLVTEHKKRFDGMPPDFFTCGGFCAAMAVATAIKKAGSTDTEALIAAMEGMTFDTPKGEMKFRKEDHQAMQDMYHYEIKVDPNLPWAVCDLVRTIPYAKMDIPIRNKK